MNKNKFDRWIFESYSVTPQGLGFFRIAASLFILFFLMPDSLNYAFLSSLPDDFYAPPPGPLMLLESFPAEYIFWTIHVLLVVSLFMMLAGYFTKFSSIAVGLFALFLFGLTYSIGKINHHLLVGVVPVVMAFSNWGAAFSADAARGKGGEKVESWPLTLLALMIGFMMFTAGVPKILGGWLDPGTQATKGHFLNQFFVKERQAMFAEYFYHMDMNFIWELMDWGTIIFETGFLLSVLNSRWFKLFVCFAVIFHFSTLMILNIAFLFNYLAYAAFLDWTKIYLKFREWSQNLSDTASYTVYRSAALFGLTLLVLFFGISSLSYSNILFLESELALYELIFSVFALVIVLYLGIIKARTSLNNRREVVYT